jgi:hypothetical protein
MCKKIEEQKTKCGGDFAESFFRTLAHVRSTKAAGPKSFFAPIWR